MPVNVMAGCSASGSAPRRARGPAPPRRPPRGVHDDLAGAEPPAGGEPRDQVRQRVVGHGEERLGRLLALTSPGAVAG